MTLTPAYGRTYKKQTDILSDFNAGKDFLLHTPWESGRPINKEQLKPGTHVTFRYGRDNTKVLGHIVK